MNDRMVGSLWEIFSLIVYRVLKSLSSRKLIWTIVLPLAVIQVIGPSQSSAQSVVIMGLDIAKSAGDMAAGPKSVDVTEDILGEHIESKFYPGRIVALFDRGSEALIDDAKLSPRSFLLLRHDWEGKPMLLDDGAIATGGKIHNVDVSRDATPDILQGDRKLNSSIRERSNLNFGHGNVGSNLSFANDASFVPYTVGVLHNLDGRSQGSFEINERKAADNKRPESNKQAEVVRKGPKAIEYAKSIALLWGVGLPLLGIGAWIGAYLGNAAWERDQRKFEEWKRRR